jgi:hypothetical protein
MISLKESNKTIRFWEYVWSYEAYWTTYGLSTYPSSNESRVHSLDPSVVVKTANRRQVHNRRLCEQELESIVVRLESGLKARFLPWLHPGSPEEADSPIGAIRWPERATLF